MTHTPSTRTETGYPIGTTVRITLPPDDPDAQYNGLTCKIIADNPDDLHKLTGNETDKHHYDVQNVETGDTLPVSFRHNDVTKLTQ